MHPVTLMEFFSCRQAGIVFNNPHFNPDKSYFCRKKMEDGGWMMEDN